MLVIEREEGMFVAKSGSEHSSYTTRLEHARKFKTRQEAEKEKCGNETIVELERVLDRYRQ